MTEVTVPRLPEVVDIGPKRQLFVDDQLIDTLANISRFVHQPAKHEKNPVFALKKQKPLDSQSAGRRIWGSVHRFVQAQGLRRLRAKTYR